MSIRPYPIRNDNKTIMEDNNVYRIIDQINPDDKNFEYVCFSQYNEPFFLISNIFKYVKYANSKNVKNLLITNALLLNQEKKRKMLVEAGPSILKISLQTINLKNLIGLVY